MQRRLVLIGLSTLAASPAFSQSTPAPAMKVAPASALSGASADHIKNTLAAGSLSLATSRIAASKVQSEALKQFVTFEIAEQETIADIINAMMKPGTPPSGEVKVPSEAEVMANVDAKGKAVVEDLRAMKPGKAFERAYVKAQIDGHRVLLAIQETYLKAPSSPDETNVAKLAKGMITEHLTLLGDIEKQLA